MPWCPKCKNEYKDGYTVCADCGSQLVASLDDGPVAVYFGEEALLNKMCDFMHANGIKDTEVVFDEKENTYELYVSEKLKQEAQKHIRVFLTNIEAPRKLAEKACKAEEVSQNADESEESESVEEKQELHTSPYQEADKKAEEYKSGADTLIIVGVLGIIMLVLLNVGIIPIALTGFSKILITAVMGTMFVLFVVLGVSSRNSYKKLKVQAGEEKDLKSELKSYLEENIRPDDFDAELIDDEPTMEILYFRRNEKMKEMIKKAYPSLDAAFIEYIIEETYPEIFE